MLMQREHHFVVCATVLLVLLISSNVAEGQTMPAVFVLGDSLVDPGNNNYILTLAKSNFPPNGIDYPGEVPTGRFCNGFTVLDLIAQKLGLPSPPPYLAPTTRGPIILQGVSYASAAGGILDFTGYDYIGRLSFNTQLQYFQNTRNQIVELIGEPQTEGLLAKALFYIVIGSNDYINNYLVTGSPTPRQFTPAQFQDLLINTFSTQLRTLYNLGARKFLVLNVGPLGCIPSQLTSQRSPDGRCIEFVNSYVRGFNAALKPLLAQLTGTLPGATYAYANAYDNVLSYVLNPGAFGFTISNVACCGAGGPYKGLLPCIIGIVPCPDRPLYVFWDPFHPTQTTNNLLANLFFSGGGNDVEPVNVQQLAAL